MMLSRRLLLAASALLPLLRAARARAAAPLDDRTAPGFVRGTVIAWGDRVEPDSPPFDPAALTAQAARRQFGWDAILAGVLAQQQGEDGVPRAIMVAAHPAPQIAMLPSAAATPALLAGMQGASVLNLEYHGRWLVTDGGFQTRRLTAETLCRVGGPASARIGDGARGPSAPTAACLTPWNTALIAETPQGPSDGFVVEIDPLDPDSLPTKRTALGRIPRAGIACHTREDGTAVVLMSEEGGQGRLFRFVSAAPLTPDNRDALDAGVLSVAVLEGGTLQFVPVDDPAQANGTGFDFPAGIAPLPNGEFLLACRGDAAALPSPSPLGEGNPNGRILLFRPESGESYSAELALAGGDTGMGGATVLRPASLAATGDGGVWIGADASGIAYADERFTRVSQVYVHPVGAVIGGVAPGPDNRPLFAAIRHPGAAPGASYNNPATRWPTLRPDMPPQTVVIALSRG
jgi:uncharacterized protein